MTGPDPAAEPTVVRIEAPRVEGTIPLEDIARRLAETSGQHAARSFAAPAPGATGGDDDRAARLQRLSRLAAELADELAALPEGSLPDLGN